MNSSHPHLLHIVRFALLAVGFLISGLSHAQSPYSPSAVDPFAREAILRMLHQANDWQTAHPHMKPDDRNWERGTWYTGVMAAYKATKDEKYLNQAMNWGKQHEWQVGTEKEGANRLFCAETWVELAIIKKDKSLLAPTVQWLETKAENSPAGSKEWYLSGGVRYADSLYGASALAMLAQATGDAKYVDTLHAFFWDVADEIFDKDTGLCFRDKRFLNRKSPGGNKILWSRGNGWVLAGIARILEYLPANDPQRPRYVALFQQMTAAIAKSQGSDGLWRPNLADPERPADKETSGTGFFCFAMAWGIRNGVLDRETYLPVVKKAWAGLAVTLSPEGMIQWGQLAGDRPMITKQSHTAEYVTGIFLLAGSEMIRLLDAGIIPEGKPSRLAGATSTGEEDRAYSVKVLIRIAGPVLTTMSENQLHARFPTHEWEKDRKSFAPLEALCRTLAGIAPWLALGADDTEEGRLRGKFIELARRSLINATDPKAADYCDFDPKGRQPLVESAFLSEALLRAPEQLWNPLTPEQKANVVAALNQTRSLTLSKNNWCLFSSIEETALWEYTGECNYKRLEIGVNNMMGWYLGDGTYGDGKNFCWDYYNSYVIQPMLLDIVQVCAKKGDPLGAHYPLLLERARRYAVVQERLISPDGTFPVIGRSSVYRFGAFRHLSYMVLKNQVPKQLKPGATRAALTAVIRRMIEAPGAFDENGWLQVGAVGHQPSIREFYITTGSLYLCLTGLLHLGLPPSAPFWTEPATPWTQQRIWAGEDIPADHGILK